MERAHDAGEDRRRSVWQRIALSVEVRTKSGLPLRVQSSDVSSSGCYLEMMTPLAKGATVELSFTVGEELVSTEATVRTSDLGVGMGIEFVPMGEDSKRRLQKTNRQYPATIPVKKLGGRHDLLPDNVS
jgi:PilZ domain